jgi:hypothetical protein
LRPGNLPKGKAAVNLNWDLEILPKGKAAASFYWDLEIFLPKGKAAVSFYWDLEILPKGCTFLGDFTAVTYYYSLIHAASVIDSVPPARCPGNQLWPGGRGGGSPVSRGSNLLCGLESSEPPPPFFFFFCFLVIKLGIVSFAHIHNNSAHGKGRDPRGPTRMAIADEVLEIGTMRSST